MVRWYGLDGRLISIDEADELLADGAARTVARTMITTGRGRIEVSTVFLVLDQSFGADDPPVLWETMVFGGPLDDHVHRYASPDGARRGHAERVTECRAALAADGVAVLASEHLDGPAAGTSHG